MSHKVARKPPWQMAWPLSMSAREGDLLTARSVELSKAGRTGVYDSEITNQRGERIAMFRGRSYTIKGKPAVAD